MTDHAPLTDKELAELDAALDDDEREKPGEEVVRYVYRSEVRRLIADLRASRAEVERLRILNGNA